MEKILSVLNGLISDPDRGLLIVVLALVVSIIALFTKVSERNQKYKLMTVAGCFAVIVAGFVVRYVNGDDGPIREVQYHGYFGDVKPDKSPTISSEVIHFKFSINNVTGHSTARVVDENNIFRDKEWSYRGLAAHKGLTVSYKTIPSKEEGSPQGFGTIIVKPVGQRSMAGIAVEYDCVHDEWDLCPYVLSQDDMQNDQKAIVAKWPIMQKPCQKIDIMSDLTTVAVAQPAIKVAENTNGSCQPKKKN